MNYSISWVKLEKYAELTGDSVDVAKHRIKSGKGLHGDQVKIIDGRLSVNLHAVERWAEEWELLVRWIKVPKGRAAQPRAWFKNGLSWVARTSQLLPPEQ